MVVVRVRVIVELLFLRGCGTAGHHIFAFVVEVLCCRVVGRRVGVGRVEGLFLVCLVSVYCVFVPLEFVATASALLFCCLSRWSKYLGNAAVSSAFHRFFVDHHSWHQKRVQPSASQRTSPWIRGLTDAMTHTLRRFFVRSHGFHVHA